MAKSKYIFLLISFLTLFLNFYSNYWGIAQDDDFRNFDHIDESMVYGRLARSNAEGILSYGGFPGLNEQIDTLYAADGQIIYGPPQKEIYLRHVKMPQHYKPYRSQPGAQIMVYAIIDKVLLFSPETNLEAMLFMNALLVAFVFTFFVRWVLDSYGLGVALTTTLLIILSPWLSKYGHSLWMVLWTYFLPMVGLLVGFNKKYTQPKLLVLLFVLFFIKCLFSGFEFISCTFLSIFVPIAYYYYLDSKTFKNFCLFCSKAAAVCIFAIVCMAAIVIVQNSMLEGNFASGIDYLVDAYHRRSGFDHTFIVGGVHLPVSFYIIGRYLGGDAFRLSLFSDQLATPFGILIGIVFASLAALHVLTKKRANSRTYRALIVATVLSFFVSISWFVFFQQHAYYHPHYDFICWYVPFLLFGFVSMGCVVSVLFSKPKPIA